MSLWLVFDTSCPTAVVGVVDIDRGVVCAEVVMAETRLHAERLPAAVDEALQSVVGANVGVGAPVAGIGVGVGPGSFIGVRTGIAYAKGLCRAWGVPLVGLPTLPAVALSIDGSGIDDDDGSGEVTAVIDARRGERYLQSFAVSGAVTGPLSGAGWRALGEAVALPVAEVPQHLRGVVVGVDAPGGRARNGASVRGLLRVLRAGPRDDVRATLTPLYVRAPDAKLPNVDPARHRPTMTPLKEGS